MYHANSENGTNSITTVNYVKKVVCELRLMWPYDTLHSIIQSIIRKLGYGSNMCPPNVYHLIFRCQSHNKVYILVAALTLDEYNYSSIIDETF